MPVYALGDVVPRIDPTAWIHPDAVVIGDVEIGAEASVWPGAVLRGDDGPIRVGERTSVQDGTVIHVAPVVGTRVGSDCVIGHLVHLEGCTIEDRCLVGSGAIVLSGAVVGPGALVGAGAFVGQGKVVPPGARALGVPAVVQPGKAGFDHAPPGVRPYVERIRRFAKELRPVDAVELRRAFERGDVRPPG